MKVFHRESASRGSGSPRVIGLHEPNTGSCQYICMDEETRSCALIDVVLEFNPESATQYTSCAEWALHMIKREKLKLVWIETHPHADHLMASHWLHERIGAPSAIGEYVVDISQIWGDLYHLPDTYHPRADFDKLLADGDTLMIGELPAHVMLAPGHTLGSIT